jgi:hypothetical protein
MTKRSAKSKAKREAKKKCAVAKKHLRSARKQARKALSGKVRVKKLKTMHGLKAALTAQKAVNSHCGR